MQDSICDNPKVQEEFVEVNEGDEHEQKQNYGEEKTEDTPGIDLFRLDAKETNMLSSLNYSKIPIDKILNDLNQKEGSIDGKFGEEVTVVESKTSGE